jgi:hypothetical protein
VGVAKINETAMKRQDTKLEAEGAEFLVLGNLLIEGIAAYKTYTNMPGFDIIATDPDHNTSARIQVKSRWKTDAEGFFIKNFDCDFVVVSLLNRGSKDGKKEKRTPEFYVIPVSVAEEFPRTENWGKVSFSKIPGLDIYAERWDLIADFLKEI